MRGGFKVFNIKYNHSRRMTFHQLCTLISQQVGESRLKEHSMFYVLSHPSIVHPAIRFYEQFDERRGNHYHVIAREDFTLEEDARTRLYVEGKVTTSSNGFRRIGRIFDNITLDEAIQHPDFDKVLAVGYITPVNTVALPLYHHTFGVITDRTVIFEKYKESDIQGFIEDYTERIHTLEDAIRLHTARQPQSRWFKRDTEVDSEVVEARSKINAYRLIILALESQEVIDTFIRQFSQDERCRILECIKGEHKQWKRLAQSSHHESNHVYNDKNDGGFLSTILYSDIARQSDFHHFDMFLAPIIRKMSHLT